MDLIIITERLLLREFQESDAVDLFELNADPDVIRYTGDPPFESVEGARQFVINYRDYTEFGMGRWAVLDKSSGEFLGWCGLKKNEEGLNDLGFRFFKRQWGKGYATEAALACLHYGFNELQLQQIVGRTASANKASVKVLEKIGMGYWKSGPCHGIEGALYYRFTRDEFQMRSNSG